MAGVRTTDAAGGYKYDATALLLVMVALCFACMLAVVFVTNTLGRYELGDLLGRGPSSCVYRAKSFGVEGFERTVAIKVIEARLSLNDLFEQHFVAQAKRAIRLQHANIAQVYDIGKAESDEAKAVYEAAKVEPVNDRDTLVSVEEAAARAMQASGHAVKPRTGRLQRVGFDDIRLLYLVQEHVDGCSLDTVLADTRRTGRRLSVGLSLHIAAQVAQALDHAHRRCDERMQPLSMLHEGICPSNILLSWQGEVKLADFGSPYVSSDDVGDDSSEAMERKIRHVDYLSPEQARGEGLDVRTDVFSLGLVLYEMISGVNPFRAATPDQTLERGRAGRCPSMKWYREDLPSEVLSLVPRILTPTPEQRIPTAAQLFEALQECAAAINERCSSHDLATFLIKPSMSG